MKTKLSENVALDLAVAELEGWKYVWPMHDGSQVMVSNKKDSSHHFNPSENWGHAGPIIEREGLTLRAPISQGIHYRAEDGSPVWRAINADGVTAGGATALVAAMKCYVASRVS